MLERYDMFSNFISQKVMPLVYDESLSYYEVLNKLIVYVNDMVTHVNTVIDNNNELKSEYNVFLQQLADLNTQIQQMKNSFFINDGSINYEKFSDSCKSKLQDLIADTTHKLAKFVCFGLDDDGYFYAAIPDSWDEIKFSSDVDGHLILEF